MPQISVASGVSLAIALLSGAWEYRYLQRSIAAFPPAGEFAEVMRASGLRVERAEPMTFGVVHLYVGVRDPAG